VNATHPAREGRGAGNVRDAIQRQRNKFGPPGKNHGKSGAKFDINKANWYNQEYLRAEDNHSLARDMQILLAKKGIVFTDLNKLAKIAHLMKERAHFIPDLISEDFFFAPPTLFDKNTRAKKWNAQSPKILQDLIALFESVENWQAAELESVFKNFMTINHFKLSDILPIFRLTVTGKGAGPSMFEVAEVLGKEETLGRMRNFK
jgi:glutamyl-tRNA synthetase